MKAARFSILLFMLLMLTLTLENIPHTQIERSEKILNNNSALKQYYQTLDLVYSSGSAIRYLALSYNDPAFDIYLEDLPATTCYVVIGNGSYYYSVNCKGKVEFYGENATAVIHQTFSALTNGRTWLERIVYRGVFEINATIHIPSYTELAIYGMFKLVDNAQCDILSIDGDYVYIHGGVLDGNKANCPNGGCGINANSSHRYIAIDKVLIRNTTSYGIVWAYNRSTLFFSRILNSDSYGIYVNSSSTESTIALNMILDNALGAVQIEGDPDVRFVRNTGFPTEAVGVVTFSGDGSRTDFSWQHNLALTPNVIDVTPLSADAAGAFYVTANSTHITVHYRAANPPDWTSSAPPEGTDNVVLSWHAICLP